MELNPGLKSTEIGLLPPDWEVKHIGDLGRVVRGGSPRPAGDPRYFNGSFMPWLTVASLTNVPDSQLRVSHTVSALTEEGVRHSRIFHPETVIIANSGATLGVAKVLGFRCCANDGIAAVIDQRRGDKSFLAYYINSITEHLREVVAPGNGQPNLNTSLIRDIALPFPPEEEQRHIGQALADMDSLLSGLLTLIAKKRDLKQAVMQELLSGRSRLPGFRGAWSSVRLGDLGPFSKGRGIRRDEVRSEGYPCVRYGEIYTHHSDHVREFFSFVSADVAKSSRRMRSGDLLFAASGETVEEIGKCVAFLDNIEAYAGGDIVILSPAAQDSRFLGYLMNHRSIAQQKANFGQGDAVVHISASNLARIQLRLPERLEQQAIANVLWDMDTEILALERRLTKTRALKQGMMQALLTGRVRLAQPAAV